MPNYDYQCTECNFTFEKFQQMTDSVLKKCPHCKGKLKRLIGAGAGLIFKGSGFYTTDYKKTSGGNQDKKTPAAQGCSSCEKCPQKERGN